MTYKQAITDAMTKLAIDPAVCFIGYGITRGKAMGTLSGVSAEQLIEFPVAENLMVGAAIGMALRGRKPVVFIERADFLLNAMDAIVNHLCKIELMSRGEFKPAVMLRIVVGNKTKPLFTGETHVQDFREPFALMANDPEGRQPMFNNYNVTMEPFWENRIGFEFAEAHRLMSRGQSSAFWEMKDLY